MVAVMALEMGCVVRRSVDAAMTLEMGCGEVDTVDIGYYAILLESGLSGGLWVMALETDRKSVV